MELLRRALKDKERGLGNERIEIEGEEEEEGEKPGNTARNGCATGCVVADRGLRERGCAGSVQHFGIVCEERGDGLLGEMREEQPKTQAQRRHLGHRMGRPAVKRITRELLENVLQRKMLRYDKAGEEHYNLISAAA